MVYFQHAGLEKSSSKNTLSSKTTIQNRKKDKEFPRQTKTTGFYDHKNREMQELLKGAFEWKDQTKVTNTRKDQRKSPETIKQVIKWQ